jgi:uncharacterized protein (DUF1684 family)
MKKPLLILLVAAAACQVERPVVELPENYQEDLQNWKLERDQRLRAENGWVNLAGLFWLEEGNNTFGSSADNDVVFPASAPQHLGTISLQDSVLKFIPTGDEDVYVDSVVAQSEMLVFDPSATVQAVMEHGRYRWFIIERSGNYGIRLRDLDHPNMKEPLGIEYFDWSADWYVKGTYHPFDEVRTVTIDNVVGFSSDVEFEGEIVFKVDGVEYALWPSFGEDYSFIMFGDATSGDESYGVGRYLVASVPDENNEVILDFNRAYNPPCAFTDFATCGLPPEANILEAAVRAGEKAWH